MRIFLTLISLLWFFCCVGQDITPKPASFIRGTGKGISISNSTMILYDAEFTKQASYMGEQVQKQCGLTLVSAPLSAYKNKGHIRLVFDTVNITQTEMYRLEVKEDEVILSAKTVRGIVNGIQTFLQLLPLKPSATCNLERLSPLRLQGNASRCGKAFLPCRLY